MFLGNANKYLDYLHLMVAFSHGHGHLQQLNYIFVEDEFLYFIFLFISALYKCNYAFRIFILLFLRTRI